MTTNILGTLIDAGVPKAKLPLYAAIECISDEISESDAELYAKFILMFSVANLAQMLTPLVRDYAQECYQQSGSQSAGDMQ